MLKAIEDGRLDADRWSSYRKLTTENLYNTNEAEYMKAKKQKFKEIAKLNKKRKAK